MLVDALVWVVFIVGGLAPFAAMGWKLSRAPAHKKPALVAAARPAMRPDEPVRLPDAGETADAVRRFHRAVDRYLLEEGVRPEDWRGA